MAEQFRSAGREYDAMRGDYLRLRPLWELGRRREWEEAFARFDDPALGSSGYRRFHVPRLSAMTAIADGRLDDAFANMAPLADASSDYGVNVRFDMTLAIRWARGDAEGALRQVAAGLPFAAVFPALHAQHAAYLAALGRDDDAAYRARAV